MSDRPKRSSLRTLVAAVLLSLCCAPALAQVYKCTDENGKTTYADAPCGNSSSKLRLQGDDARQGAASPVACTQLQDEIQRLGTQADRDAARGRKPSTADASRRQTLSRQYASRCAGITLSAPASKSK